MANLQMIEINKGGERADFRFLVPLEKILRAKFKIKKNISLALISPAQIKKLNRVYRHQDKVTDVLSFNIDSPWILGEVLICLAQAKKQAGQRGVRVLAELKLLTVHGILHLLGYDHEKNAREERRQTTQEQIILRALK